MTQRIRDTIGNKFGAKIANQYTQELADAIEQEVADQLIDIVANIYGQAIGELFTAGTPELTPQFGGVMIEEITAAVKDIPPSLVGGLVTELIKTRLNANLNETLSALVDSLVVEQLTAKEISEAEKASSAITLTVYTFKGS
jgi:hypothetical protein